MQKLIFYTNPQSRGRIVRLMLEELAIPYETRVVAYKTEMKGPDYLAINPMGKVPAIQHGDQVVTELAAICTYLADQYPEGGLAPQVHDPLRGTYYRWLFFAAGPLEMALTAKAYNWHLGEDNRMAVGCGLYEDTVNTLEHALQNGPYVCGDLFTAADICLASHIRWGLLYNTLEHRPIFQQYVDRIFSRPAILRAGQLDDALDAEMNEAKVVAM